MLVATQETSLGQQAHVLHTRIRHMKVLIVDESMERAQTVLRGLALGGHECAMHMASALELPDAVERLQPDVIIIGEDSPTRDTLEHIAITTSGTPRPIVMFVEDDSSAGIRDALRAGVSAYIVDGLDASRIKSIVEVAVARFDEHRKLVVELDETRMKLAERSAIERAKGILMKHKGLSEEEAFKSLRSLAMQKQRRLGEIAAQVIAAAEILG
jgi:two-component system, response regulator / RNA-binding antiterminator